MHLFRTASSLQDYLTPERNSGRSIGFVPTMGALHQGHLSLIEHSTRENDLTVVSIFVNPTQFNNAEDLEKYPRNIEDDIAKLETTACNALFHPDVREMYPEEVASHSIDLNGLDLSMEGAHRPGHFDGVATVVHRFFELVKPHKAYFGEKDFQQLQVIRHMNHQLDLGIEIVGHPIERSEAGLALSSRNQRLTDTERETALDIINTLRWAKDQIPEISPVELRSAVEQKFGESDLQLEYVEIVNEDDLKSISAWKEAKKARIFVAAYLSGVRLIDNLSLF